MSPPAHRAWTGTGACRPSQARASARAARLSSPSPGPWPRRLPLVLLGGHAAAGTSFPHQLVRKHQLDRRSNVWILRTAVPGYHGYLAVFLPVIWDSQNWILQIFVTRPSKTCPLDQFSQLITNMVSDFAVDQHFCMIFTFNDRDPGFYNFKCRLPPIHFLKITFETALARKNKSSGKF